MRLFTLFVMFLMLVAGPALQAADSPPAGPPAVAKSAEPTIVEIDQLKLKVLAQDLTIKQLQYQQAQTALQQLQSEFNKSQGELQALVDTIYKKAGVTKEAYDINLQSAAFVKKEPQPAPSPKK